MRRFKFNLAAGALLSASLLFGVLACSAGSSGTNGLSSRPSQGASGSSGIIASGGSSASSSSDPNGVLLVDGSTDLDASTGDAEMVPCTNGDDCVCPMLSVAVIGTPGLWGAVGGDSDTAFQDWLTSSSAGTARVDIITKKPTLTADFLSTYDLIILAGLGDNSNSGPWWTFSAAEIAAFQAWIESKPGGVISLSGYSSDVNELTAKNALLAFTGISYNQDELSPPCADLDANNSQMCWCADGSLGTITDFNRTDPAISNVSLGVNMIGDAKGRSIHAPADALIAATMQNGAQVDNLLVGKLAGRGRVLVYTDEWITYTSQWDGQGNPNSTNAGCKGYLPQDKFETAQFWYDMIRWTQPNATCFKIVDTNQPVVVW